MSMLAQPRRIIPDRHPRAPEVSVVVPAYNEAHRLTSSLPRILDDRYLRPGPRTELIVVDDGSQDETASVARRHLPDIEQARVLRLPWHAGKGAAVRLGVSAARGHSILFMDADLATNLAVVPKALDLLADTDVVVGSRATAGAVVRGRSTRRSIMHRTFRRHACRLTGIRVSDPQCGLKAFHADVAKILFHLARTDGFGFDVEILLLAAKLGFSVREIPVDWTAVDGSKVRSMRDPAAMARDITWARVRHGRRPPPVAYTGNGR
jgi:glycosyltransferase involved in cell wall biosynthesis